MNPLGSSRSRLLLACVSIMTLAGCGKKTTEPEPAPAPYVNPVKPNANGRISSQTTLGDADKGTQFDRLERFDDGSLAFSGPVNGTRVVGVLEAGGALRWTKAPSYFPEELIPLPASSIVPRGVLVVGVGDANHDGTTDIGVASLYSSSGTLLSEITSSSSGLGRWFYQIIAVSDSQFIAGGLDHPSGVERPFLQVVNLKSPGTLEFGPEVVLSALGGRFIQLALVSVSPSEVALAAVSRPNDDARNLHGLRAPWPAFDPVSVEWTQAVVPPGGAWDSFRELVQSGGNLYMVGYVKDNTRPVDPGGQPWSSGVAASYTTAGDPRWIKLINLSAYADRLYSVKVGSAALYATGEAAAFVHSGVTRFGYGLVSKLDPADGHLIANFTTGDEHYSSGFPTSQWTGGALICAGWTRFDHNDGPYRGWLVTMDVSGSSATSPGAAVDADARTAPRADAERRDQ